MLNLFNTLGRRKEELKPINKDWVGLYTCGPTVYNFAHIGNLRTYIFEDILQRTLEYNNYTVRRVMNITDVGHLTGDSDAGEEKMDAAARAEKKSVEEIAQFYTDAFFVDLEKLNIKKPDIIAPATKFIGEQISIIEILIQNGFAYDTPTAVYFDVSKFKDYGKLSGQSLKDKTVGAREEVVVDAEKHNAADFALWFKLTGKFKNHLLHWSSPWGDGFPGWHIECSAISRHFLSQPFDIHTGGVDHIGTHHENEIAQSEAAFSVPLAHIWMHGEFLDLSPIMHMRITLKNNIHVCPFCGHQNLMKSTEDYIIRKENDEELFFVKCENCHKEFSGGIKMAKSAGNFLTLTDLEKRGYHPLVFRYLLLGAHYRTKLNFTWESLDAAKNAIQSLYELVDFYHQTVKEGYPEDSLGISREQYMIYENQFLQAINDDLNAPQALAILWEMLGASTMTPKHKLELVERFDSLLGLKLTAPIHQKTPEEVLNKLRDYQQFRANQQFTQSDALRKEMEDLGYVVRDTKDGSYIVKKFF